MNFEDIIEMLLQKKANLRDELEREYAAREAKIDALLDMAGYVPPVVEVVQPEEAADAADIVDPCGQVL